MKGNQWIIGYAIVSLLLVGGAGAFAFMKKGEFEDADRSWSKLTREIEGLEGQPLYPNKKNLEAIVDLEKRYVEQVNGLFASLKKYQRPLNPTVTATELQQKIRKYSEDFKKRARTEGFSINDSDGFYMGMEAYASDIPSQKIVPLLDYQLDAFNNLANQLADAGVSQVIKLERDNLPGERGAEEVDEESLSLDRYPMRFRIRIGSEGFQEFINTLANDEEFFTVMRVLKVENSAKNGPAGQEVNASKFYPIFIKDGEEATEDMLRAKGYPDVDGAELAAAMSEDGYFPQVQDARVLFGEEELIVDGVIDLVRFFQPNEGEADAVAAEEE